MRSETLKAFNSFAEFYPYYLQEHSNDICRRLHYVGSLLVLGILAYALLTQQFIWLFALPFAGYGFAWIGHFVLRKTNRPPSSTRSIVSWETGSCSRMLLPVASVSETISGREGLA